MDRTANAETSVRGSEGSNPSLSANQSSRVGDTPMSLTRLDLLSGARRARQVSNRSGIERATSNTTVI